MFHVSEDASAGDAQFYLKADLQVIGGLQTATASHAAGQTQDFTVTGLMSSDPHRIELNIANYSPTRAVYVSGISYDGVEIANSAGKNWALITSPAPATKITVNMSEDAYQGDAIGNVAVDGTLAGTATITASHVLGQETQLSFLRALTPGTHYVQFGYWNDLYGGSAAADRNAYLDSIDVGSTHIVVGAKLESAGMYTVPITVGGTSADASQLSVTHTAPTAAALIKT